MGGRVAVDDDQDRLFEVGEECGEGGLILARLQVIGNQAEIVCVDPEVEERVDEGHEGRNDAGRGDWLGVLGYESEPTLQVGRQKPLERFVHVVRFLRGECFARISGGRRNHRGAGVVWRAVARSGPAPICETVGFLAAGSTALAPVHSTKREPREA